MNTQRARNWPIHIRSTTLSILPWPSINCCLSPPKLRAALAHKGVAVPGSGEARHVGGLAEAQVCPRVQQLLVAAGGWMIRRCKGLLAAGARSGWPQKASAAGGGGRRRRSPGLAGHVAEPVGAVDPLTQSLLESVLLQRQHRTSHEREVGCRCGAAAALQRRSVYLPY